MDAAARFGHESPLVGMVHLPPLPGAPGHDDATDVLAAARRDARRLAESGMDAVLVENFGDAPFYPEEVPRHTVASMTAAVREVRECVSVPVGVNVLRSDGPGAVAVAAAGGAGFVRVNVHVGARVTDQGVVEGRAHETVRLAERLGADVAVCADVDVKHSEPLADVPVAEQVAATVDRGHADALVVSGSATGEPTAESDVEAVVEARDAAGFEAPVLVGSGVTPDAAADLLAVADGAIVGTALKHDGDPSNPVDSERVSALVDAARR